jgi:hypothetical protein
MAIYIYFLAFLLFSLYLRKHMYFNLVFIKKFIQATASNCFFAVIFYTQLVYCFCHVTYASQSRLRVKHTVKSQTTINNDK